MPDETETAQAATIEGPPLPSGEEKERERKLQYQREWYKRRKATRSVEERRAMWRERSARARRAAGIKPRKVYRGGQKILRTDPEAVKRREYQRERTARLIAAGLTSKGKSRKREYARELKPRSDRQRGYQRAYYYRRRAAQGLPVPADKQHYLSQDNGAQPRGKLGTAAPVTRQVIFCPCCGANIENVRTAVNFAE